MPVAKKTVTKPAPKPTDESKAVVDASGSAAEILLALLQAAAGSDTQQAASHVVTSAQDHADIHMPELYRLLGGIVGASTTRLQITADSVAGQRLSNNAITDNLTQLDNQFQQMLGHGAASNIRSLSWDRLWNIDENNPALVALYEVLKNMVKDAEAEAPPAK
jgi:hypothetical protein